MNVAPFNDDPAAKKYVLGSGTTKAKFVFEINSTTIGSFTKGAWGETVLATITG